MPAQKRRSSAARPKSSPQRALSRYRAKRDFTQTPEPTGGEPTRNSPARSNATPKTLAFCVQKHLASHLHYDFRLQHPTTGTLLSWAVPKGPSLNPRDKRLAMRVEDHPFDYKDFEGVIPSGYGAGVVMLWDEGAWAPEAGFEDVAAALRKGELKFRLDGTKLKGAWVLVRTGRSGPTDTGEREQWLLIKHRDEWAGDVDVAAAAPRSIKSDLTFAGILKSNPDVWESHKAGDTDELEKIVAKVAALGEEEAGGAGAKGKPAKAAGRKGAVTAGRASRGTAPPKKARRT